MKRWLPLVLILLAGACASFEVTGPGDRDLEFSARALQAGEWLEEPVVEVGEGERAVSVKGRLSAPDPCRQLSGTLQASGSELVLRVTVAASGAEACIAVIGTFEYDAGIVDLAPGAYRLRVIHTYPGTGWPTSTVFDQVVQVR